MTNIETTISKRKYDGPVAKHTYLDAAGNTFPEDDETEENAQGYRYTLLANKENFDWQWAEASDDERRMLAIFGAKTLATNITSGARNNSKGAASPDEQMQQVRERFEKLRQGTWAERAEGGFAVDKSKLAQAVAAARQAMGKAVDTVENYLRRFEEEDGYMAKCRKVPEVAAEYAKLAGRGASIDATD
jgi:hypothetical protein